MEIQYPDYVKFLPEKIKEKLALLPEIGMGVQAITFTFSDEAEISTFVYGCQAVHIDSLRNHKVEDIVDVKEMV